MDKNQVEKMRKKRLANQQSIKNKRMTKSTKSSSTEVVVTSDKTERPLQNNTTPKCEDTIKNGDILYSDKSNISDFGSMTGGMGILFMAFPLIIGFMFLKIMFGGTRGA